MRNGHLHRRLELFTVDASRRLTAVAATGAEMPFEVVEQRGGTASLYCYRPLTGEFIAERMADLATLESHAAAVDVLAGLEATDDYLHQHGAGEVPPDPIGRAKAVLRTFLEQVFADRGEFGFEPALFESAYAGLERALYEVAARRRSSPRCSASRSTLRPLS